MENATQGIVAIMTLIVSAALLALLVSKRSQTANVITSAGQGFSALLGAALAPITENGISSPMPTYH